MGKSKVDATEKLNTVHGILCGKESISQACTRLNITNESVEKWIVIYQGCGSSGFSCSGNKHYSKELKDQAVSAYLHKEGSLHEICKHFGIKSKTQLQQWIKKYNSHEELRASGTGGTAIMTQGRKTTFDERIEIVQYCISHDHNYAETSEKYKVSYQQARSYTVKYEAGGIDALQDNRGKRKSVDSLSEVERLRAELKLEKARRQKAEMEVSFLKKLDEIERRRG